MLDTFDTNRLKDAKFQWEKGENKHTHLKKYDLKVIFTVDVDKVKYKGNLNTK